MAFRNQIVVAEINSESEPAGLAILSDGAAGAEWGTVTGLTPFDTSPTHGIEAVNVNDLAPPDDKFATLQLLYFDSSTGHPAGMRLFISDDLGNVGNILEFGEAQDILLSSGNDIDIHAADEISLDTNTPGHESANVVVDNGRGQLRMNTFPDFGDGVQVVSGGFVFLKLGTGIVQIDGSGNISIVPEAVAGELTLAGQTQLTHGVAGGGDALPATPDGYLRIGNGRIIPFYAAA